jgi:hypothetical protein
MDGRCEYSFFTLSPLSAAQINGCMMDISSFGEYSWVWPLKNLLLQDERMEIFLAGKKDTGFLGWMAASPFKGLFYDQLIITNNRIILVARDILGNKTECFRRLDLTGSRCDGDSWSKLQKLRLTFNQIQRTFSAKGNYCEEIASRL